VSVDAANKYHYSALLYACMKGHADVATLLLDAGAKINQRDIERSTPLHWTAVNKHVAAAEVLVSRGAKLELKDTEGNAPINEACLGNIEPGSLEIVKLLVEKGATVDLLNRDKGTPLQDAAAGGLVDVVTYLVERGANLDHVNKYGFNALVLAMRCNQPRVVETLLRLGASPTLCRQKFDAAIVEIGEYGFNGVVGVLKKRGLLAK
jgi:ankyrin repeat protein